MLFLRSFRFAEFRFHFLQPGASEIAEEAQIGAGDAFGQAGGTFCIKWRLKLDLFQAASTKVAAVICTVIVRCTRNPSQFQKKSVASHHQKMHGFWQALLREAMAAVLSIYALGVFSPKKQRLKLWIPGFNRRTWCVAKCCLKRFGIRI